MSTCDAVTECGGKCYPWQQRWIVEPLLKDPLPNLVVADRFLEYASEYGKLCPLNVCCSQFGQVHYKAFQHDQHGLLISVSVSVAPRISFVERAVKAVVRRFPSRMCHWIDTMSGQFWFPKVIVDLQVLEALGL